MIVHQWDFGDVVTGVVALAGLISTGMFVIAYARRSGGAWSRSEAGRYFMIHHALLAALFLLILANRIVPGWPGRELVTSAILAGFVLHTFSAYKLLRTTDTERQDHDSDPAPR